MMGLSIIPVIPDWVNSLAELSGLELWKFVNLAYLLRCAFISTVVLADPFVRRCGPRRRDQARTTRAREERDQALAKLAEVEARFAAIWTQRWRHNEKAKA